MSEERSPLLKLVALAGLVIGSLLLERARHGLELYFIAFVLLLAGPAYRLGLALRGRGPDLPRITTVVLLSSFAGVTSYPFAHWAQALAGAAVLSLSLPPLRASDDSGQPASRLEHAFLAALALVASAIAVHVGVGAGRGPLVVAILAPLLLEAWGPGASRLTEDLSRRASAFALVGGGAVALGAPAWHPGFWSEDLLFLTAASILGLTIVVASACDVVLRGWAGRTRAEITRRRKRALLRTVAVTLPLLLAWTTGEAAFRLVPNRYREVTLGAPPNVPWHAPGGRYVYYGPPLGPREEAGITGNEFVWNKEGLHDVDHEIEKPPRTARVLVLGDSYVEGTQVKLEELYHRQLERALAGATPPPLRVESIAIGNSGWGQAQELDALRERGLRYRPDLVIVEFLPGNDVRNNLPALEDLAGSLDRSVARRVQAAALLERLYFTAFLAEKVHFTLDRLTGTPTEIDTEVYRENPPHAALWTQAWARTDALVADLAAETARAGTKLVIVCFTSNYEILAFSSPQSVPAGLDMRRPARLMGEIARRHGVPYVDLAPRFGARGGPDLQRIHLKYDGHWTPLGHRWAAEETSHYLVQESGTWLEVLERAQGR